MVEIMNMSQWKSALTMTAMVKPYTQIEPFHVLKGNEICFILFSVIVLKISREFLILFIYLFFAIAAVRDLPVLDMYMDL